MSNNIRKGIFLQMITGKFGYMQFVSLFLKFLKLLFLLHYDRDDITMSS